MVAQSLDRWVDAIRRRSSQDLEKDPSLERPPALLCPADEVHWLQCDLDDPAPAFPVDVLSADEAGRAARLKRRQDRQRFVAARAWLRYVLGRYADVAPAELGLSEGPDGKPTLVGSPAAWHFNMSHSGGAALLAVTRVGPVGVDIEVVSPIDDAEAIARRHFAPTEWLRWSALPAHSRTTAFYACWTRKEAYVKALGGGLFVPLNGFEVAFEPGAPPALLSVGGSSDAASQWTLWALEPTPRLVGAVVVRGSGLTLRHVSTP